MPYYKKLHNFLLYLYAFALPFEYWNPFGLVGAFSIVRLVAIFYFIASFFNRSYSFEIIKSRRYLFPLVLLLLALVLSNIFNSASTPAYEPLINQAFIQNIVLFWLFLNHFSSDIKTVNRSLFAFTVGIVLLGILYQFEIGIVLRQGRVSVFGDNPNNQGTKVAIAIFLLVYFLLSDRLQLKKFRFLLLLPIPNLLKFLADTASRGALITLFIGLVLLIFFLRTKNGVIKLGLILFGFVAIVSLYQFIMSNDLIQSRMAQFTQEGSLGGRSYIWEITLNIFLKSPFYGVGESGFVHEMILSPIGSEKSTHNYFLYVLVTSGIIGFAFFLYFLLRIYNAAIDLKKYQKEYLQFILFLIIIFAMLRTGGSLGDKSFWFFFSLIAGSQTYFQKNRKVKSLKLEVENIVRY